MADGSGRLEADFGDGRYTFRLAHAQLRDLQEKTGLGPEALYHRIRSPDCRLDDLRETLRIGLIGGGMKPMEAHRLIVKHFDDEPPMEHKPLCAAIILAAWLGPPIDSSGKGGRKGQQNQNQKTGDSLSPKESV